MQSMGREIVTLKRQLGFRVEVDEADEDESGPAQSTAQSASASPELIAWRNARAIYWAVSAKNQESSAAWMRKHRDEFSDDAGMVDAMQRARHEQGAPSNRPLPRALRAVRSTAKNICAAGRVHGRDL